jgi:3-hydroxyisobutyrate dehydrogenase-like beta-hydroxyacid dehydrogenase
MKRVIVFGDGRVGTALATRMSGVDGWQTDCAGAADWRPAAQSGADATVLAVTHGDEAFEIVRVLAEQPRTPSVVVDLTTQPVRTAEQSQAAAGAMRYVAGGLTGGLAGVRTGAAVLLLGGPGLAADEKRLLTSVGMIIEYPDVRQGIAAKLLHNWYQLITSFGLAEAAATASALGMSPGGLIAALHTGPAGRPVGTHSLVRDWLNRPQTSYEARLALKDLPAIEELLRERADCAALVTDLLAGLADVLRAGPPDQGFTTALLARGSS